MKILGGKDKREKDGQEERVEEKEEEGEKGTLRDEEIERHIKRLKKEKVAGEDTIPNGPWIYIEGIGRGNLKEQLRKYEG